MLSKLIIFAFLGISLGFQRSSNVRFLRSKSVLNSYNNEKINGEYEPFKDSDFLSIYDPSTSDDKTIKKASNSMQYHKVLPAMSLLAILSLAGNVDAVDLNVVDAPLQGMALYLRYFLCGGLCCSFSHGIAVPFDVVKTRLQTSASDYKDTNVISVAKNIADKEGFGMLFSGLGPTLSGYLIQGSLKYGFYEIFKPLVCAELYHLDLILPDSSSGRLLTFAISGFFAEFIGSTFLSPFEAARIRLVTTPTFADGVVDCMNRIVREEKIESLFRGLPAVFAKQIPFTVVQLASFEFITTSIYSYLSRSDNDFDFNEVSKYKYAISGVSAVGM
jgi:hypothetical protein